MDALLVEHHHPKERLTITPTQNVLVTLSEKRLNMSNLMRDRKASTSKDTQLIGYAKDTPRPVTMATPSTHEPKSDRNHSTQKGSRAIGAPVKVTKLTRQRIRSASDGNGNGHAMQWITPKTTAMNPMEVIIKK